MIKRLAFLFSFFFVLVVLIPALFCLAVKKPLPEEDNKINEISDVTSTKIISSYIVEQNEVINIGLEEYITGVVAAEMPAAFEKEALKAQAVAARSYILSKTSSGQKHDNGADVCNNPSCCKAYITKEKMQEKWGEDFDVFYNKIKSSVDETKNCVCLYDGKIINAVFHSTSSGKTENASDIWNGQSTPYLVSVVSYGEELSPKFKSSSSVTTEQFKNVIKAAFPDAEWNENSPIVDNIKRSDAGSILSLTVGNQTLTGADIRSLFNLRSANISFDITDSLVTMNVTGNGHGVGLSQYGANYLASQGKGFVEILKTYYTGIDVVQLESI